MNYKELSPLTSEELSQKLISEQKALTKLRFAHAISPLEKPMSLRETRRNIARIKTLQNERRHIKQQPNS